MSDFLIKEDDGYLLQEDGFKIILEQSSSGGTTVYGYRNIPSLARDIKPILSGGTTQGHVSDPGITYNEAGVSYNDSRYSYGGFYGRSDFIPTFSLVHNLKPILAGGTTQALVNDQNITYNQIGVSYNDSRYTYGGLYGFTDVRPLISLAKEIKPTITGYEDVYTQFVPPPPTGSNNAPGWFMFLNL